MSMSGPTQMLVLYGGVAGLVYAETDGFRMDAPFLFVLPLLALALLTLSLTMKSRPKYFTAASFLLVACGLYLLSVDRRELGWVCALVSLSHVLYLLSFTSYVRRVWVSLAALLIVYLAVLLHHCFADVFWSIPSLVIALALHLTVAAASVLAAGSVWLYGSKSTNAHQADLLRFLGLIVCLVCSSVLVVNQFGVRFDKSNYILNILYYVSQGLLFIANERAF